MLQLGVPLFVSCDYSGSSVPCRVSSCVRLSFAQLGMGESEKGAFDYTPESGEKQSRPAPRDCSETQMDLTTTQRLRRLRK